MDYVLFQSLIKPCTDGGSVRQGLIDTAPSVILYSTPTSTTGTKSDAAIGLNVTSNVLSLSSPMMLTYSIKSCVDSNFIGSVDYRSAVQPVDHSAGFPAAGRSGSDSAVADLDSVAAACSAGYQHHASAWHRFP